MHQDMKHRPANEPHFPPVTCFIWPDAEAAAIAPLLSRRPLEEMETRCPAAASGSDTAICSETFIR